MQAGQDPRWCKSGGTVSPSPAVTELVVRRARPTRTAHSQRVAMALALACFRNTPVLNVERQGGCSAGWKWLAKTFSERPQKARTASMDYASRQLRTSPRTHLSPVLTRVFDTCRAHLGMQPCISACGRLATRLPGCIVRQLSPVNRGFPAVVQGSPSPATRITCNAFHMQDVQRAHRTTAMLTATGCSGGGQR